MDILDLKEFIKDSLDYFITFLIIFLVVIYILGFSRVIGCSMEPSLYNGDIVVTSNSHYNFFNFKRGDVISFSFGEIILIKRVVGLPGDIIKFEDGIIYINEEIYENDNFIIDTDFNEIYEEVEEGYIFILGDNQLNSLDSREIGLIPKENVNGKLIFRFFPFNNMGFVN